MNALWVRAFAATALVLVVSLAAFAIFSTQTVDTIVRIDRSSADARALERVGARLRADRTNAEVILADAAAATGNSYFLIASDRHIVASAPASLRGRAVAIAGGAITFSDPGPPERAYRLMDAPDLTIGSERLFVGPAIPTDAPRSLDRTLFVGAAISIVVALLASLALTRSLLGPIGALTRATQTIAAGDYSARVPAGGTAELSALARAFNAMATTLARDQSLRATLVADLAHEVRTPLTNLKIRIESLQDGIDVLDPAALGAVHADLDVLERLIDDVQELAVVRAAPAETVARAVAIPVIVEPAVHAFAQQARAKGIDLRVELSDSLPSVRADVDRTRQVVANLIVNALRHTPANGSIAIGARREGAMVRISVRDTGEGLAESEFPLVFERAHSHGGSGLGLAIVKQIVAAQGGEVAVESVLGAGSTFSFTLPVLASS